MKLTRESSAVCRKNREDSQFFWHAAHLRMLGKEREIMDKAYVHGYDSREIRRLQDQANTLVELLHSDTSFQAGSRVLEAGCGVGAQTVTLARNSPKASFTSIDISKESIDEAKKAVENASYSNVQFQQADIFNLEFEPERRAGGNAMIGRELYPLLTKAGFNSIHVSPRMVYVDSGKPDLVEGFTRNTFTAMIEGIRDEALRAGIVDQTIFDNGIRDLYRTTEADGVFCYTFFKAVAAKK